MADAAADAARAGAVFDRLDGENHTELAYGLTGTSDRASAALDRAAPRGADLGARVDTAALSAKSYGMLAMAHRQATATPVDRYLNGLGDVKARKLGQDTAIVIFDDVAGSGESLRTAASALGQVGYQGPVLVSPMISTEMASTVFNRPEHGVSSAYPNVEFSPRSMSRALEESFFYQGLDGAQREAMKDVADDFGYGDNALSVAFPYMAPDNNSSLFGDLIAKFYIFNRNARASKSNSYTPPSMKK